MKRRWDTVYEDQFLHDSLKTPPAARLIQEAAGIQKGFRHPQLRQGSITMDQARPNRPVKMADLNANDIEGCKIITGTTARSMGINVEG